MKTWGSNHRIFGLPCWTSTSKNYSPSFHGVHKIYSIQTSFKFIFSSIFFIVNFVNNKWYFVFFWAFYNLFQIKLSTYGSKFNSLFVSMSELEFFFVDEVLDSKVQHFRTCKISWKKPKTLHLNYNNPVESDIL
jgi:hypothetical protein